MGSAIEESRRRFAELRELCSAAGDTVPLVIGMSGRTAELVYAGRGRGLIENLLGHGVLGHGNVGIERRTTRDSILSIRKQTLAPLPVRRPCRATIPL